MLIKVGVSKRHVHLTKETYKELFNKDNLDVRNNLNQPGQYASTETVDLKWNDIVIPHVRIIGPFRPYNQVEIDENDAKKFNLNPPRRQSGDLEGSLPITIIGPCKEITISRGLILAERHIHMDEETAKNVGLEDKEVVSLYDNDNYICEAKVKVSKMAYTELHIDTKEEQELNLHQGNEVILRKCGK